MNGHLPDFNASAGPSRLPNGSMSSLEQAIHRQHASAPNGAFSPVPFGVVPIPAVQPKIAYEPPVFRTFLDRKREKDRARLGDQIGAVELSTQPIDGHAHTPVDSPQKTFSLPPSNSFATPPPISVAPMPSSRPLPSPKFTPTFSPPYVPASDWSPSPSTPGITATVERSDTLASIRSLDRQGFPSPSKRPLPKPPVTVNSSRSLDRGNMGPARQSPRWKVERRQPSVVEEEGDESPSSPLRSFPRSPQTPVPAIVTGTPSISVEPEGISIQVPSIVEPEPPGMSIQVPVLNFPDDEPVSPAESHSGVSFSGPPVISVSTEHSDDTALVPRTDIPTQVHPTQAIICAGCQQPIIGRIVNAMKQRYHPACFKCDECGELLEHVSSFEWEGKAYCHLDYHDKFAHRCFHCKTPIVDSRFVTLNDPVLGERFYHELHFFCSECGDPFLDPSKSSAPGAPQAEEEEGETNPFVIHKGHPYCERCHIRLHKPKCKACHQPIPDIAVNAMGAKWHQDCFRCSNCNSAFANNLFFPKDGRALCTSCYEAGLQG